MNETPHETLQFPLALLAYLSNHSERLEAVITYATFSTGMHRLKVLSPSQADEELADVELPKRGNGISDEQIRILALGGKFCGVCPPDSSMAARIRWDRYQQAENFIQAWKEAGMTSPWTRVSKAMCFEVRDGTERIYPRFAALCAVNAAIGSKPFAIVTRNRVRAGMLGYPSGKLIFDQNGEVTPAGRTLLDRRGDKREPVTTNQARTLLDNLVKSNLLHRFTPYRGSITYYSKTLSAEMIGEQVLARAKRTASNPRLEQIGEQIRLARNGHALLSGEPGKAPHNSESPHNRETTTQAPPDHHQTTTQSPHNAASYAAPNASLNATENAEALADLKKVLDSTARGTTEASYPPDGEPSLEDVRVFMEGLFRGAGQYAEDWFKRMVEQGWKDYRGRPIQDWKKVAARWASTCERRNRRVGK